MKEILNTVEINGKAGIGLRLRICIEGEEVYYEKANSLTLPFLTLLSACFNDGAMWEDGTILPDSGVMGLLFNINTFPSESDTYQNEGVFIRSVSGSTVTVDVTDNDTTYMKQLKYIWIVSSKSAGESSVDGFYEVTNVDSSNTGNSQSIVDSGTTDGEATNKLIDSSQNFTSTVSVNDVVRNTTTGENSYVTAVDSDTQLSIGHDIMETGESYQILNNGDTVDYTVSPTPDTSTETGAEQFYPVFLLDSTELNYYPFFILDIRIGDSSTAVEIDHLLPMQDLRADFTNPAHTVDEPVISASSSKIAITKAFTNNSGSAQTVREVALLTSLYNSLNFDCFGIDHEGTGEGAVAGTAYEGFGVPIARDVITDKAVADGETITITYEFTVSEDGQKGVLANFNELMYRQMAFADRTVEDYINTNRTADESEWTFSIHGGDEEFGDEDMSFAGIQVGTHDSNTVDIDDRNLNDGAGSETRIAHGEQDGQLYYYGSRVKGWTKASSSEAYVDVVGIFENRGSTSVDVNECGFNVICNDDDNDPYPVLISRHILDVGDRQTLASGDFLKVTYRFKISTS